MIFKTKNININIMNYFIEKNILLDDVIENLCDNLSYDNNIYYIFGELRNNNEVKDDIILFEKVISNLDNIIYESNEYLKTIVDLEFQYNYICSCIDDLYNSKYQIINFMSSLNKIDILSELIEEININ
jgi:hypothetical protein